MSMSDRTPQAAVDLAQCGATANADHPQVGTLTLRCTQTPHHQNRHATWLTATTDGDQYVRVSVSWARL